LAALVAGFGLLAALLASMHALLHKRDSPRRDALARTHLVVYRCSARILYLMFGVNRIRRRAISLRLKKPFGPRHPPKLRRNRNM